MLIPTFKIKNVLNMPHHFTEKSDYLGKVNFIQNE